MTEETFNPENVEEFKEAFYAFLAYVKIDSKDYGPNTDFEPFFFICLFLMVSIMAYLVLTESSATTPKVETTPESVVPFLRTWLFAVHSALSPFHKDIGQ